MASIHQPLPAEQATTLCELFRHRVAATPDMPAYQEHDPDQGWLQYSWAEIGTDVALWQAALLAENLEAGDRVAVMLPSCLDWVRFDQAALGLGLVVVPLYLQDRPDNVAYVLNDSGAKLLLVESRATWSDIFATGKLQKNQLRVVVQEGFTQLPEVDQQTVVPVTLWLDLPPVPPQSRVTDASTLATIVYTSGTTGRPKGVMLSHHNIVSNLVAADEMVQFYTNDLLLSFLPLSHILERTVGYYLPIYTGSQVAYARSVADLMEDLQQIRPTLLISVPRIFERAENAVRTKLAAKPKLLRWLFELTLKLGWQQFEADQQRADNPAHSWLLGPLHKIFAKPVLAAFGGRLRAAVCGGAPLPASVSRTFSALGLPLLQGYGLTETSPIITGNRLESNLPHSVGELIPGVEVKIAAQQEILYRGPSLMMGYWNNPAATAAVIDAEGWFHTGDCGRLDGGRLFITGRLKEIIVLANGEKLPPADMQHAIEQDPLIEQCMVIGEGKPFLAALVVICQSEFERMNHLRPQPLQVDSEAFEQELITRIAATITEFPGYARIHRVAASIEPWEIDNGLLTPTLKLKRPQVETHFSKQITALYAGH